MSSEKKRARLSKKYEYEAQPDVKAKYRWRARVAYMLKRYGLDEYVFVKMHWAQNGLCAACGKPPDHNYKEGNRKIDLVVDHDHKTDAIRGLLCWECNLILGYVEKDWNVILALKAYLERHAGQEERAKQESLFVEGC